jgi:hypothetical protein
MSAPEKCSNGLMLSICLLVQESPVGSDANRTDHSLPVTASFCPENDIKTKLLIFRVV